MPKTLGQLATEVLQKKYEKPANGIPETDLEDSIEQKLDDLANQVDDVQVNGQSVVDANGVANVPIAGNNGVDLGVLAVASTYGISRNNSGRAYIAKATDNEIKGGAIDFCPIVPMSQHKSAFYGLAKAAGADMKDIVNTIVGTYQDAQKAAIQRMLGITDLLSTEETTTATAAHALNSLFLMGGKLYKVTAAIAIGDAVVEGENCQVVKADEVFPHDIQVNGTSIMANGVANIPRASNTVAGVLKTATTYGTAVQDGIVYLVRAISSQIKDGAAYFNPIVPNLQHESVFYGLAKAAGSDEKDSSLPVGQYTDNTKAAIRGMLGAASAADIPSVPVQDVQVNGTSVLSNGIANVPMADATNPGAIIIGTGLYKSSSNNKVCVDSGSDNQFKAGAAASCFLSPQKQHISTFYGLAKAAGADEKDSTLSVGAYTESAKTAIRTMLGIDLTSIASEVEIPLVETVSGTTPTISGQPNTRYVCGEVSTLSITPPSAGSIDVIFDSGSTPAVITVPNTVRWPAWFDATALEADTTYEILITDGVYGSVMTWEN